MAVLGLSLFSCSKKKESPKKPTEALMTDTAQFATQYTYTFAKGTVSDLYEYVSPKKETEWCENNYVELVKEGNAILGFFHGTTDEFDQTRSMRPTGFFVLRMGELKIDEKGLRFQLTPSPGDFFAYPLPINFRDTKDALNVDYKKWAKAQEVSPLAPKTIEGTFQKGKLILKDAVCGKRTFIMK